MKDNRPANCRFRLADEGKPYPRSSCQGCGRTIATGLGKSCQSAKIELEPAPLPVMKERYYVNVRDDSANNPAFIEISESDYHLLRTGSAIFLPGGYTAILNGQGQIEVDGELARYLQFRAVRFYAIVAPEPGKTLHTLDEVSNPT